MTNKKCDVNFEMSSEKVLGISEQPNDTCINNHPLCNAMYNESTNIRNAVANVGYEDADLRKIEFEKSDVDLLQGSIDGFFKWFKGLKSFYEEKIKDNISDSEVEQYDDMLSRINDCLWENDGFYLSINTTEIMENQNNFIDEISEKLTESSNIYTKHEDEVSDLESEISNKQNEIDENDDESLSLKISEMLELYEEKFSAEPWEDVSEEARELYGKYEKVMNSFGEDMQNHFTDLRKLIDGLKTMIKHNIAIIDNDNNNKASLFYPNDHLKDLIKKHTKKDEIITSATPYIFIKRVRDMESANGVLDYDDKEILFSEDDERESLAIAMDRFKMDYPQYKTLFTYKDEGEALKLTLGVRISLSLEAKERVDDEDLVLSH
jgi:hypothetical protein